MYTKRDVLNIFNEGLIRRKTPLKFVKGSQAILIKPLIGSMLAVYAADRA